jgi:hypothetical protein
MAYDAATGNVVLFGAGQAGTTVHFAGTWTWDGSAWTKQHPASHPEEAGFGGPPPMAYDAATSTVVLWDSGFHGGDRDTWTWDGTTWTRQTPASSPSARSVAAMTYDAATGNVVLFGGQSTRRGKFLDDTWTWG